MTGPTGTGNTDLCKSLGGLLAPLAQGLKGGRGGVKLPLNLLSALPAGASGGAGGPGRRGDPCAGRDPTLGGLLEEGR